MIFIQPSYNLLRLSNTNIVVVSIIYVSFTQLSQLCMQCKYIFYTNIQLYISFDMDNCKNILKIRVMLIGASRALVKKLKVERKKIYNWH